MAVRAWARELVGRGATPRDVATHLGVSSTTVHRWLTRTTPTDHAPPRSCPVSGSDGLPPGAQAAYSYLLGQYLGDGHLVTRARVPVLRVYACTDYPAILAELHRAVYRVRGTPPGHVRMRSDRVVAVQSYWMHWPCLLPQHGPGRKHERPIVLTDWQESLIRAHPWPFLRGLFHSDGCRSINRVTAHGKAYAYPRYFLANESADILAIAGRVLDAVGVAWRYNRPNSISVARRSSVALLDEHIGSKT